MTFGEIVDLVIKTNIIITKLGIKFVLIFGKLIIVVTILGNHSGNIYCSRYCNRSPLYTLETVIKEDLIKEFNYLWNPLIPSVNQHSMTDV